MFDLAVWDGETTVSVKDAADLKLCKQESTPTEWYASVEAFYVELCSRYPEIDTLPDGELDGCPLVMRARQVGTPHHHVPELRRSVGGSCSVCQKELDSEE